MNHEWKRQLPVSIAITDPEASIHVVFGEILACLFCAVRDNYFVNRHVPAIDVQREGYFAFRIKEDLAPTPDIPLRTVGRANLPVDDVPLPSIPADSWVGLWGVGEMARAVKI